jgi:hypothetical protein
MKNIIATFLGIHGTLLSCLACSLATQSFVALCVSRTAGTDNIITFKNRRLNDNFLSQDRKI